jgi:hypothetical protein
MVVDRNSRFALVGQITLRAQASGLSKGRSFFDALDVGQREFARSVRLSFGYYGSSEQ